MILSDFVGKRMAEFQFGKMVTGWVQFVWFLPLYAKQFNLGIVAIIIFTVCALSATWIIGFISFRYGFVKGFKSHELKGVQVDVKKG